MRKLIWLVGIFVLVCGTVAHAQVADTGSVGVAMGHVHFAAQDVEAAKNFWIAVGGKPINKVGANEVVKFPGVLIFIRKATEPTAGTVGSVINHIGFLVPDIPAARAKWQSAGLIMEPPNPQNPKQIYLHSPDNLVRVEVLEDAMQAVPIKFHHVHFFVANSGSDDSVKAIQAWYAKTFGAKPGKRGQFEAADLPGVNLTFAKSDTPTVVTKGRELDHIGFEIKDLKAFCKNAEAAGIKFDMPYTQRPELGLALAFITDPWGTSIELNEGLDKL